LATGRTQHEIASACKGARPNHVGAASPGTSGQAASKSATGSYTQAKRQWRRNTQRSDSAANGRNRSSVTADRKAELTAAASLAATRPTRKGPSTGSRRCDQGSQFTSDAFTATLKRQEIAISMDGKGRCTRELLRQAPVHNADRERGARKRRQASFVGSQDRLTADAT
jgi:transposase InsO family protein